MPTPFGLPNWTSGNPLTNIADYSNSVTSNYFWNLVLILIFIVTFMSFRLKSSSNKSVLTALTVTSVLASILSMGLWVSPDLAVFLWLATGLMAVLVWFHD